MAAEQSKAKPSEENSAQISVIKWTSGGREREREREREEVAMTTMKMRARHEGREEEGNKGGKKPKLTMPAIKMALGLVHQKTSKNARKLRY